MAAGTPAKENTPTTTTSGATTTATASAVAASRRRGYAVKSCGGVKKRAPRLLGRRVPLRDITNLVQAISAAVAGPDEAPLGQEVPPAAATELAEPDAVVRRLAALRGRGDDAAGPAAKPARYYLQKGFR